MRTTVKFTCPNRQPLYGVSDYPPVGEWSEARTPVMCQSGWHVSTNDNLTGYLGIEMWVVEVDGAFIEDQNKATFERMRFVRKVEAWDLAAFAQSCAEYAAEYAAESAAEYAAKYAEYAAESAAKYAAEYAESAAKSAAKAAKYAAEYAAKYAARYAEYAAKYAAESAAKAAEYAAEYAAESAAGSAELRECRRQSNYILGLAGLPLLADGAES